MSRLHVHRGFIQSLKLCLNLYSFRWINPSQSLVINLSPSGLKMSNSELGIGQIIFMKVARKILKLDVRISKLSLFHSFIVHWFCRYYLYASLHHYIPPLIIRPVIDENTTSVLVACQNNVLLLWHAILSCTSYYFSVCVGWNWI